MSTNTLIELHLVVITQDDALTEALRQQFAATRQAAFQITRVPNVSVARAFLATHQVDALLLDLDLENTHKLDGLITLRSQAVNAPVVVFAPTQDADLALAAVRAGAQDFLTRAQLMSPDSALRVLYAVERYALSSQSHLHAEQLQFSEARFRLMINENADGIVVVNQAGVIRFANPAAENLFGVPRQELVGTLFMAPLQQPNSPLVELTRGQEKIFAQQRMVETVWNRENVWIVTLRDITAERLAQEQLAATQVAQEHHRRVAQALADSAAALNSTLSYEQVLDRILENIERVAPHDAASIFLIDGAKARYVRGVGFDKRGLAQWLGETRFDIAFLDHLREMRETQRAVVIPETHKDSRWRQLGMEWIRSYVGAPLRVRDEVIGFLNVDSETPNFFSASHAVDLQAFADQAATALENARLHAQVARRAERLAEMYDLARELAMQRDSEMMWALLVERAIQILDTSSGGLLLYAPETNEIVVREIQGAPSVPIGARIELGVGTVGRAALLREPALVNDYAAWEFRQDAFVKAQVTAALSVPMLYGAELVGVLSVHQVSDATKRFTQDDAKLLMMLAAQAAALLRNTRLRQEAEKRAQQLALVYDAGLTLNRVLEPRVQLDFLSRIAMRSVRANMAVFYRFDPEAQALELDLALGYQERGATFKYRDHVPLSATPSIEAWVARERMPALIQDVAQDARFARSPETLGSGIWVPVEHDDILLGVLAIASAQTYFFTPDDERLLVLFASQAAVAMENARLYQSVLRENERRNVLHRASQEVVSAGLDAERVYAAIHQAVSQLMPCEAIALAVVDEDSAQIRLPYMYDRGGRQPVTALAKSQGLSGRIIDTGAALNIGHLAQSNVPSVNFGYPVQVVSVLGVPLRYGSEIIGALLAESYEENAYDDADRVRLEMLAAYAAAALMNARGYENLRRALRQPAATD